ncbi:glycosyltransferase family 31 protein [Echria macrotheca]|uniref:Glycosyltransferase family 31 protein n=1 Tax=Echria macrotheca TaxID=438768 RepID=A0AAJ0F7I6_9PEZI|nr:glycosyltransferase family 31 protein [Echria macrotheca]
MYARCRAALQRASVSRRFTRRLPILTGLILGLLVWTAVSLRQDSPLFPLSVFGAPKPPPPEPPPERPRLPGMDRPSWEPGMCNVPEIEFLRRPSLELTSNIVYSRRCIKPSRSKSSREAVANITEPLVTTKTKVDLADCSAVELPPCETITLQVPAPYPEKQYRHLMFGVASTYERLFNSLPEFAHWASGTGAQLVITVADARNNVPEGTTRDLTPLEEEYKRYGVSATFLPPSIPYRLGEKDQEGNPVRAPVEQHHFMLVRELYERMIPGVTRWLGVLDDDTFFPSLHLLDEELVRHDHTRPVWLGALSDDFHAVKSWGFMGYGGAGVFLSLPLAEVISRNSEKCLLEATTFTGDGILRDCVYSQSRAGLTLVPGLYQHDIRGDPSGFFESGVLPISLHHWKSWYRAPVAAMSRVATQVCGDCLLQRWRFGNDTLLANGYSITVYSNDLLSTLDLDRVEGTWEHPTRDYDFMYGTLRTKLERSDKKSYRLRDSALDRDPATSAKVFRQVYVYRADEFAHEQEIPSAVDEVIELIWEV